MQRTDVALQRTDGTQDRTGVTRLRTGGAKHRTGDPPDRTGGALERSKQAQVLPLEPVAAHTAGPLITSAMSTRIISFTLPKAVIQTFSSSAK